ncbi:Small ubiquitin-related modifier [Rhynchospora pubera]|uniref:Small ubiquitin-related modifier n=1 Tax=Rhynchospora pubera TaxID=906938 RepID=A0AAV8HDN4_9POAL|nr:Small ubiquitin-related modifier [Rhynchospora pubera]
MVGRKDKGKKLDHGTRINLKVTSQDGKEMPFRIKHSTELHKLMKAYCDEKSMDFESIVFLFEGRRLRGAPSFSFRSSIVLTLERVTSCSIPYLPFLYFQNRILEHSLTLTEREEKKK